MFDISHKLKTFFSFFFIFGYYKDWFSCSRTSSICWFCFHSKLIFCFLSMANQVWGRIFPPFLVHLNWSWNCWLRIPIVIQVSTTLSSLYSISMEQLNLSLMDNVRHVKHDSRKMLYRFKIRPTYKQCRINCCVWWNSVNNYHSKCTTKPIKKRGKKSKKLESCWHLYFCLVSPFLCWSLRTWLFSSKHQSFFFHVFYEFFPCVSLIFFLFDDVLFGITNTFPFIIICLRFYIWSEEVFLYCLNITILWLR